MKKIFLILFSLIALFGIGANSSFAVDFQAYRQLENIPGSEKSANFLEYVHTIYRLGLWIVGISAMFMVSVGGFLYMTSAGNTSNAGTAKGIIKDALIGLFLGLSAWLLLNTINPDLTKLEVSSLANGIPGAPTTPSVPSVSDENRYNHSDAVKELQSAGINVTSSGNCSDPKNPNCTTLEGIPKDTIQKVIALKKACNCSFNITGGTETGHASHGPGLPIVDVTQDQTLGNFLAVKSNLVSLGITKICATSAWQRVSYNCNGYVEQKPHFHLKF